MIDRNERRISVPNLLFWIAYVPWVFAWTITSSYFKDTLHPYGFIKIWNIVGSLCIMLQLLIKRRVTIRELIFIPILILGGLLVSYDNGNASFVFYIVLLMIGCREIDFKKIVWVTLILQMISCSMIVSSSLVGIIPDNILYQVSSAGIRKRHCLGYTYASFFSNYLFSIVIELLYLKDVIKWKWIEIILIFALSLFSYNYTDTRAAFVLITVILLYECVRKVFNVEIIQSNTVYKFSFLICSMLSIIVSFVYNSENRIMAVINSFLNQRLRYAQKGVQDYGIKLFGSSVTWLTDTTTYNYIDNSYINILVCYGVCILLLVVVGMTAVQFYHDKAYGLRVALLVWAVRSLIDPQLFLVWFNPFILLCVTGILDLIKKEKNNDFGYMSI